MWAVINSGTSKGQGPCNFASLCDSNENGNDGYYGKANILLNNETKQEERSMSYFVDTFHNYTVKTRFQNG